MTTERVQRSATTSRRLRLLGSAGFLAIGLVWWQLDSWTVTHSVIRWLSVYSPERFAHGALWTLPLSALLVGHIELAGVTVTFFVAVVVPYLVFAGPLRALKVFVAAHVLATMTAFAVIAAAAMAGSTWGQQWWSRPDYGASAGLVGIAGALFVLLCMQRRSLLGRVVGVFAMAGTTAFFVDGVIAEGGPRHGIIDVEHLLGLLVGCLLEWWLIRGHADAYESTVLTPPQFGGRSRQLRRWSDRSEARLLGVVVALSGAVALVNALAPARRRGFAEIEDDLAPLAPHVHRAAHAAAALAGLALLLVARGLVRRRPLAWWVTFGLLATLSFVHVVRGPDFEVLAFTSAVLVLLLQGRHLYQGPVRAASWLRAGAVFLVGAGTLVGYGLVGMVLRRHQVHPALTPARALEQLASNVIGLPGPLRFQHHFGQWFPETLTVIGMIWLFALCVALFAPRRHGHRQLGDRADATALVASPDGGTLDPFALRSDRAYLFDRTRHGAVAYRVLGGVALVGGDQFGEPPAADDAVRAFLTRCDEEGWRPAAIGVAEHRLEPWIDAGMRAICLGDEAIIDVERFTLEGRAMRPVRQACNRTKNHGLEVRVVLEGELDETTRRALLDIDRADRGREAERGFSMALDGLLTHSSRDARCVVVIATLDGVPVGFQRYVPCRGGAGLSLDAMRRLRDVHGQPLVNGVNERLIAELIQWAAARGFAEVSLNFAVFRSVLEADDPTSLERGQAWLLRRLDRHFQIESLLTFNAKFQPRWVHRYVLYRSVADLGPVAAATLGAEGYLPNLRTLSRSA